MNFKEGSYLDLVYNMLSEEAPIIGRVLTSFKVHRLGQRLKTHEKTINELSYKVNQIDNAGFTDLLKNFLFPIIIQDLLEEDEESKIAYFLDGFEHVIDNKIYDNSKILIYYDLLKELRYIEIEHLISFSHVYNAYKSDIYYKTKKYQIEPLEQEENLLMKFAVENKLERLGLIDTGRLASYKDIMDKMESSIRLSRRNLAGADDREDKTQLTYLGDRFLDFFNLLDNYKSN